LEIEKIRVILDIFVAKKADAIIALAQGIRDILIQRDRNKIFVVPNGANIDNSWCISSGLYWQSCAALWH